ncbi:hypothetical protein B0H16DRAFT_1454121 [Mycena metata]|uniref:Uncharacterized protein n=1 Tax=Mycena metata TaxID=1033252 RepID=A0AAD7NL10_9AGAR|nr:hypothetical protein B0H16DRAFT_1454121 [Mycena metata]
MPKDVGRIMRMSTPSELLWELQWELGVTTETRPRNWCRLEWEEMPRWPTGVALSMAKMSQNPVQSPWSTSVVAAILSEAGKLEVDENHRSAAKKMVGELSAQWINGGRQNSAGVNLMSEERRVPQSADHAVEECFIQITCAHRVRQPGYFELIVDARDPPGPGRRHKTKLGVELKTSHENSECNTIGLSTKRGQNEAGGKLEAYRIIVGSSFHRNSPSLKGQTDTVAAPEFHADPISGILRSQS